MASTFTTASLWSRLAGQAPAISDGELLERFIRSRDEAAFELLVWRHGRLVWGVCQRVTRDRQLAEDAFQAAFLVLARRAPSVIRRAGIGGWLYRVAHRAALATVRRQGRPAEPLPADDIPDQSRGPVDEAERRDLARVLDEEVSRLPTPFREVVVLCEIQEVPNAQAAAVLGCAVGTVESRLTRARARLRARLAARGVGLVTSFAGLATGVVPDAVLAAGARAGIDGVGAVSSRVALIAAQAGRGGWSAGLLATVSTMMAMLAIGAACLTSDGADPLPLAPPPRVVAMPAPSGPEQTPLPSGVIARLGSTRFRTDAGAANPVFSPDGALLAVADWQHTVRVFDVRTGFIRQTITLPEEGIAERLPPLLRINRDGCVEAMISEWWADRPLVASIIRYDLQGRPIHRIDLLPRREAKGCHAFARSHDGRRAAVIWDGMPALLRIYDTQDATILREIRLPAYGAPRRYILPHFSLDDRKIAIGETGICRIFDLDTGEEIDAWSHLGHIGSLLYGAKGQVFTAGDKVIEVRDPHTRQALATLPFPMSSFLAQAPGGERIAIGTQEETIVWNATTRAIEHRLGYHGNRAAFSPDGKVLMTQGETIALWDTTTGRCLPVSADPLWNVTALQFLDGGRRVAARADRWRTWDVATGQPGPCLGPPELPSNRRSELSPDGHSLAIDPDGEGSRLRVIDTHSGQLRWAGPDAAEWKIGFKPDGQLVTQTKDKILLRSPETGQLTQSVEGPKITYGWRKISPDGRLGVADHVSILSPGIGLFLFNLHDKKVIWGDEDRSPQWAAQGAEFSPDGARLAYLRTRGEDGEEGKRKITERLIVRETTSDRICYQRDWVSSRWLDHPLPVVYSPDGNLLVVPIIGGMVLLDAATGVELCRFPHTQNVTAAAFSPDGMTLAAASSEAPIYLWDVYGTRTRTGQPPSPAAVRGAVAELESSNPAKAFQAVRTLHAAPKEAVPAIQAGVTPTSIPDSATIRGWIADLGHPDFATRERAQQELTRRAPLVAGAVREALNGPRTPEQDARLNRILAASPAPTPDDRKGVRAVGVLARIGTPEALASLRELACGAPGAATTVAAETALKRLKP